VVHSKSSSVEAYLAELDETRRAIVGEVRAVVLANLPSGYVEVMNWGTIAYEVPLSVYPTTYNGKPLLYAALAAQKRHNAVYLMNIYADKELEALLISGFECAGVKLDMGKSCVRFRTLSDLDLDVIGRIVAATSVERFLEYYAASRHVK
jgi:hypothetical protein